MHVLLINTLYVHYPQHVMMVTMELDATKSMCNSTFLCMLPLVYDVHCTYTGVCIQIALDMATAQNSMALVSAMRCVFACTSFHIVPMYLKVKHCDCTLYPAGVDRSKL